MKKLVALCLSVVMALTMVSSAFAANVFDMSFVRNSDSLEISVNSDEDIAFVTTTLSTSTRAFTHDLESESLYSSFETDILVQDYYSSAPKGILRTWINYTADEFLYITSVSFYVGDKIYTFSDIADDDWHYELDGGVMEQVLIIYGDEGTAELLAAIMDEVDKWRESSESGQTYDPEIKMVLHGTKDVTATVGIGPLSDLYAMMITWLLANGSSSSVPSTLTVTDAN